MSHQESSNSKVQDLLTEIVEKSSEGDYIYRGEPECFSQISSTLYRQHEDKIDTDHYDIEIAQKEMLKQVRAYASFEDETDILVELQHFGGKTNLIDFTLDFLIALFFACDSSHDKDGRIILLDVASRPGQIKSPKKNQNHRVISQKSIFVHPPFGYIKSSEVEIVPIPKELKQATMEHLKKYHGISIETIYNDILGYIQNQEKHQTAYTEFFIGYTYAKSGEHKKAISHYDETLRLNPNVRSAYINRGSSKAELGENEEAVADYNVALGFDPRDANAYYNRATAYVRLGQIEEAILDYTEAIRNNPKHFAAYSNRGTLKSGQGLFEEAIADFSEAIRINPTDADLFANRGTAKVSWGLPAEAIADFDEAIRLNPESAGVFLKRGVAKINLKHYEEANADFNETIRLDPNDSEAFYFRGYTAHLLDRNAAAKKDLEQVLFLAQQKGDEEFLSLALKTLDSLNWTSS